MGFPSFGAISAVNRFHGDRFEDLIARRGWTPIDWQKAVRCPCYSDDTGNPDPNDPVCGGTGYIYQEDLSVEIFDEQLDVIQAGQTSFTLKCSLTSLPDSARTVLKVTRVQNITTGEMATIGAITGTQVAVTWVNAPNPQTDIVQADYVYQRVTGATIPAIFTNVDYQRDYIPVGEWLAGDAIMTVSGRFRLGFRDIITIPETVIRTNELMRRYSVDALSRSLERLRYKSGLDIVQVKDKYNTFAIGTDFSMGANQVVTWLSGKRPTHQAFTIQYTGNAVSALLTITSSTITVTLTGQTDGSLNLSLAFASFPTISALVAEINANHPKYTAAFCEDSNVAGIANQEDSTKCGGSGLTAITNQDCKTAAVTVYNEWMTQYVVEYAHNLTYTVFNKQPMIRRPDAGTVLPIKVWLRLLENTNLFSAG